MRDTIYENKQLLLRTDSIPILAFTSPFAPVSAFAALGRWLSPNDQ